MDMCMMQRLTPTINSDERRLVYTYSLFYQEINRMDIFIILGWCEKMGFSHTDPTRSFLSSYTNNCLKRLRAMPSSAIFHKRKRKKQFFLFSNRLLCIHITLSLTISRF